MNSLLMTLIILFFSHFACAQDSFIAISSGGGFVGTATVYKVSKNGKVARGKGLTQIVYTEESQLKKSITRKWFRKTKSLLKSLQGFEHAGNVYYSLTLVENDIERKITWGDNAYPISMDAKNLYNEMISVFNGVVFHDTTTIRK